MKRLVSRWVSARLPAATIRLRLTALYGVLFLASSAALLAITYVVVAHQYGGRFFVTSGKGLVVATSIVPSKQALVSPGYVTKVPSLGFVAKPTPDQLLAFAQGQKTAALDQLLVACGIALAVMAVLSIWLGWLIAGRALRPLRTITNAAQDISATNLHRRLALKGPNDELRQLGNTFDALLARLEAAFDAQRRFVANASHELRTPLTYERALLEVALADPDASEATLREACTQVLAVGEQQERLIEALLTLSRSQRGLERLEQVDLADVAAETLRTTQTNGFEIDARLAPALTNGDARLIERLVANLVDNAVKYNVPHGRVEITTGAAADRAVLTVANTGPVIPIGEVGRLFQPFQRLDPDRATGTNGVGLGLSIVDAIATAHTASLHAEPLAGGGLRVEVTFP
jgi:signal transduction histidine kinase